VLTGDNDGEKEIDGGKGEMWGGEEECKRKGRRVRGNGGGVGRRDGEEGGGERRGIGRKRRGANDDGKKDYIC